MHRLRQFRVSLNLKSQDEIVVGMLFLNRPANKYRGGDVCVCAADAGAFPSLTLSTLWNRRAGDAEL